MTKAEFTERTKYTPNDTEYHYIEESYYDFDGGKDEFCKAWKKDKKNGKWELEMRLRKTIEEQKAELEAKLTYEREKVEWYEKAFNKHASKLKELGVNPYKVLSE